MISDEALMLAFQKGSRDAFEELYARYRGPIFGYFARRVERRERAEDLAQETFVAVIASARRYMPRALVRTWLYGIAVKQLSAERRRDRRPGIGLSPDREAVRNPEQEETLWIRQGLERLDPEERELLMLREYEQLSYQEIADVLEIPVNTVRSRLFRSRMALKDCLLAVRAKGGR